MVKMNELEEISNKHIMAVNKYKLVKDHKSLWNLINTAIYASTSLLCIANGLLLDNDKIVGFYYMLKFCNLKKCIIFYLRNKLLYGKWKRRIIKKLNKIKSLYEITLDDVNNLIDSAQYTKIPATHEKINDIKNNYKKTYQLSK